MSEGHSGIRTVDPSLPFYSNSRRSRIGMDRPPYASYALILPLLPPLCLHSAPKSQIRATDSVLVHLP